jgi:hypothetical protein
MVLAVQRDGGQRSGPRLSLLGDGLLDRARSTSLALLGASAAVGLATIALALNQSWPLVPGSPVPKSPSPSAALGKATVARAGEEGGVPDDPTPAGGRSTRERPAATGTPTTAASPPPSTPAASTELAVSAPPAEPADGPSGGRADSSPSGRAKPQAPAPEAAPAPAEPEVVEAPPPAPVEAPPTATTSESPSPESSVPPWSNGKGHAYGRSEAGAASSAPGPHD